jgi:hypothetical protein
MNNIFGDKQLKVVRAVGELKKAYLEDEGVTVNRTKNLFIEDIGLINCVQYDNHFVFRHIFKSRGWSLWCTCGGPAAVYGYNAYKRDGSPEGQMVLCMHHAMYNKHSDGSS